MISNAGERRIDKAVAWVACFASEPEKLTSLQSLLASLMLLEKGQVLV